MHMHIYQNMFLYDLYVIYIIVFYAARTYQACIDTPSPTPLGRKPQSSDRLIAAESTAALFFGAETPTVCKETCGHC